jgi:hypothetical protein
MRCRHPCLAVLELNMRHISQSPISVQSLYETQTMWRLSSLVERREAERRFRTLRQERPHGPIKYKQIKDLGPWSMHWSSLVDGGAKHIIKVRLCVERRRSVLFLCHTFAVALTMLPVPCSFGILHRRAASRPTVRLSSRPMPTAIPFTTWTSPVG